jgi:acetoin utilization protein AcuB
MTPNPQTITIHDSLKTALEKMEQGRFRRLPVLDEGRLVGMITERDLRRATNSPYILHERWYDDLILEQVTVWVVMSNELISINETDPLAKAALLMSHHKLGGLPVLRQGELVGIIAREDLLNYLVTLLEEKYPSTNNLGQSS